MNLDLEHGSLLLHWLSIRLDVCQSELLCIAHIDPHAESIDDELRTWAVKMCPDIMDEWGMV